MHRLALDIGTNSIGWVLYRIDDQGAVLGLADGGVMLFPDGRNPKDKASNAATRRQKRGMRRNRDRRLRRSRRLFSHLTALGLLPEDEDKRAKVFALDPYRLRAKALDAPLTAHELGRALWAINKRRGFKSNRKTDADDAERGKLKQDISTLRSRIAQSGCRTVGEYLWRRHRKNKEVLASLGNGLYRDRAMEEQELEAIRAAQEPHHPDLQPEDWDTLFKVILHQRPLRPVDPGKCTLIPTEDRAPRASPIYQRYRILDNLTNLRLAEPGQKHRRLTGSEFSTLYDKLLSQKALDFKRMPGLLKLPEATSFNLESIKRTKLDGDQTAAILAAAKRMGPPWRGLDSDQQQEVVEQLLEEPDDEVLVGWLKETLGISEDTAQAMADAPLPQGRAAFGMTALTKLVPIMRDQGLQLSDAVKEAGLGSHSDFRQDGSRDGLPYYGEMLSRHVLGA